MYKFLGIDISAGGVGVGYRYYFTHAKRGTHRFLDYARRYFSFGSVKTPTIIELVSKLLSCGVQLDTSGLGIVALH